MRRWLGAIGIGWLFGAAPAAAGEAAWFVERAEAAGVDMLHRHCGTGQKYVVETMGSGAAWLDYDGDGWTDLFLVQGGRLPGCEAPADLHNRLYRNQGDGTFKDVTAAAGLGQPGYGQGVAVGDHDNDGDPDLFLVNYGPDVLYRNNGDGTFTDVTRAAGLGSPALGSSAAFGDLDGDGDLDLYVVQYLDFSVENNIVCLMTPAWDPAAAPVRGYCHPQQYRGVPDLLYRNDGNGSFSDVARSSGIEQGDEAKGLGVVLADLDGDMDLDIYVANDTTPNFLYRNDGRGRFEDVSLLSGTAVNANGVPEASMGVDAGDLDGDGRFDLFMTNFSNETNTYFRNLGSGLFADETARSGLGQGSLPLLGFGTRFLDYDNDGDLDVLVANGHILDNVELITPGLRHAQPMLAYRNDGKGHFTEVGAELGPALRDAVVGRALATADYDRDGDLDVAISCNNGRFRLLENVGGAGAGRSIQVLAVGTRSNRDAIGAQIVVEAGSRRFVRAVQPSGSYQSSSDRVVHCGLGAATKARLTVRWPSGLEEPLGEVEAGQIVTVVEGQGIRDRRPYRTSGKMAGGE